MPYYRIHVPLWRFEGKSGRRYSCTAGAVYEAPVAEFKALKKGDYSLIHSDVDQAPDQPDKEDTDG